MNEITYVGKIDNWMDLRDKMIQMLLECNNQHKFNKFIDAIIISFGLSPENINETRRRIGVPLLSKKEMNRLKEFFEEKK